MVKGVNKSVIEISDTGSNFFNKIILFVSPEYSGKNDKQLAGEAASIILNLQKSSRESLRNAIIRQRKRKRTIIISSVLGSFLVIAAVLFLIL